MTDAPPNCERTVFDDVMDAYEAAPLRRFSKEQLLTELCKRDEDTVTMPRWVFAMLVKKDTPTGYEASKTADEIITLIKNGVDPK